MGLQRLPFTMSALNGRDESTGEAIVVLAFDHAFGQNAFVMGVDDARRFAEQIASAASGLEVATVVPPAGPPNGRPHH
jgi:thymidine phosphorylase